MMQHKLGQIEKQVVNNTFLVTHILCACTFCDYSYGYFPIMNQLPSRLLTSPLFSLTSHVCSLSLFPSSQFQQGKDNIFVYIYCFPLTIFKMVPVSPLDILHHPAILLCITMQVIE